MAFFRRSILTCLLAVCLLLPGTLVLGEESYYPFWEDSLGLYLPSTWAVLTRQNLSQNEEMIKTLALSHEELTTSFAQQHILAYVVSPGGTQLLLKAFPAPTSWSYALFTQGDQEQEELFEQWLKEQYFSNVSGNWIDDHIFLLQIEDAAAPLVTHVYATLIENNIFLWEVPVFDRAFTLEEENDVLDAFKGLLYLGQSAQSPAVDEGDQAVATLAPPQPLPSPDPAQVNAARENTPLTFDYVPSTWHTTVLSLSGTTHANAELRYYINNVGYQRFHADEEGRFSVEISSGLAEGKNTISFQTAGENGYGNYSFTVNIQRASTPLTLSPLPAEIPSPNYLVTGSSLPGAVIQVDNKQKTYETTALEDGTFSVEVYMPRMGDNALTLTASGGGYKKHNEGLTLHRITGPQEAKEAFMEKVSTIDYTKLMDNPTAFTNKNLSLNGTITRLYDTKDGRGFIFKQEETGNLYFVLADSLIGLLPGNAAQVLVTLTGNTINLTPPAGPLIPCATLFLLFSH